VWIKQPGSGLDKRQCTLQLLVRPLGKEPLPCLLFRGLQVPTQEFRRDIRDLETELYDKDCNVLWQAKAWADTETSVLWAKGPFVDFVREHLGGGPSLVLEENIRDFNLALGIAQQQSVVAALDLTCARDDGYGARRHAIYDALVAEHKARVGKPPGKAQGVKLWDQAGNDALVEGASNDSSERRSKRIRRRRA
jgi:hypothetical protein